MTFITQAVTLDHVISSAPSVVYYSATTRWWTHDINHVRRHPETKQLCDPRGEPIHEARNVADFFRRVKLNARESVYGKHGLTAFIAAHNSNCRVSETDPRPTCLATWKEYNDILDQQNAVVTPKPTMLNADLTIGGLPEKTVWHDPNPRVMEKDEEEGEEEEEDEDEEEDSKILNFSTPLVPKPQVEFEAPIKLKTVQSGPDSIIPIKPTPTLENMLNRSKGKKKPN
jgi:hypothetical protein